MTCTSSCESQAHESYGACLKSQRLATTGLESTGQGFGMSRQKAFDQELDAYQSAVGQGVQPATTKLRDIRSALDASDRAGQPFRADK